MTSFYTDLPVRQVDVSVRVYSYDVKFLYRPAREAGLLLRPRWPRSSPFLYRPAREAGPIEAIAT